MDLKDLHDYLERLAREYKDIMHDPAVRKRFAFYHFESLAQQFNTADDVFVAVESPLGSIVREGLNHRDRKRMLIAFHVKCGVLSDNAARLAASDKAERIAKDWIMRMVADGDSRQCPRLLKKVDASSFVYEHMESKMPNFVTCMLGVELQGDEFLEYNPNNWIQA